MAPTKPQEVGFFLPQVRWAPNRHLLPGSCLSQFPWELLEMEARSHLFRLKHLVTSEVSGVVQDMCRELQAPMEPFIETGQYLEAWSWSLEGNTFGQQQMPTFWTTELFPTPYVQGSLLR